MEGMEDDDEEVEEYGLQRDERSQTFLMARKQASQEAEDFLDTLPEHEQFLFASDMYVVAYGRAGPRGSYLYFVWDVCRPFLLGIKKRFEAENKKGTKRTALDGPRRWKTLTKKESRELLLTSEPSPKELKLYTDADKLMRRSR